MYLTDRDKEILRWIEEHKSITINQCSKIFYTNNKEGYQQARKRLRKLNQCNYIKRFRKDMRSETVYYLDKKLSFHDLKVFDILAELIYLGAEIKNFEKEYVIPAGEKNYRSDALIEFIYNKYYYIFLVEIDHTHFTSFKKLIEIYKSNFFQEKYKEFGQNIFPEVLILREYETKNKMYTEYFNIHLLTYEIINKIKNIL